MNLETNKVANIYARKSLYVKQSESISNQISECEEYIKRRLKDVLPEDICVYQDEGYSGKNTSRPAFQKMLSKIENSRGKSGYVVCYKLDRISRSILDFVVFVDKLKKKGFEFVSVKENFDTSTSFGRSIMALNASFAEMEREAIAERTRDNMLMLARLGRWLGGVAPFGFDSVGKETVIIDGQIKRATYLQSNEDAKTIAFAFDKFLSCGSLTETFRSLPKDSVKSVHSLNAMLQNPVYCTADKHALEYFSKKGSNVCFTEKDCSKKLGIVSFNRHNGVNTPRPMTEWILALGKHQGIVPGEKWVMAQSMFTTRGIGKLVVGKNKFLLSNLVRCPICDNPMTVCTRANVCTYMCRVKRMQGVKKCNSKNYPCEELDAFVLDKLQKIDEKSLRKRLKLTKHNMKVNRLDYSIEGSETRIMRFENDKIKLFAHLKNLRPGSPLIKNIEKEMARLDSEIEKETLKKNEYRHQFDEAQNEKDNIEEILKCLDTFKKNFKTLEDVSKKSLIRFLVEKIVWRDNKWEILFRGEI